jgi:hypothetical protein
VTVAVACCEYGEGGAGFFGVYLIKFEEYDSSGLEVAHPLERICIWECIWEFSKGLAAVSPEARETSRSVGGGGHGGVKAVAERRHRGW